MLFHMIVGFSPRRTIMANTSAIANKPNKKLPPAIQKNDFGGGVGREEMIAVAAYFCAEHRGFGGGNLVEDWLAAEAEIDSMLNSSEGIKAH
ncbi:MAG: hypothetical protein AWT59_1112 [Candidatus Gallionella acididurans]|uniref:DUF2934 domain-containing protein n=1 Tax=Candidatus Gallionella acididurans TaxID=1796491 RepID=A0A139BUY0_9PROT|nr:MAG: hypothetical protein AWT59_1112 [Candidatus Gallionella acididurans]